MNKCSCGRKLDDTGFCDECDKNTCDVCGRVHKNVRAGRWLFYCTDNPACKQKELDKVYDNELAPALESGELDDYEILNDFI